LDGATFSVVVPEQARVAEIKRAIATLREVPCFTMELFVKDVEEPLDDERRVGLADRVPLFLLTKCPSDRLALEAFFKSTGGAGWTDKTGWMTDAELGDWHGVEVDEEGRVAALKLQDNGLAGTLPSDIQQLSALQILTLHKNQLSGPIPAELGQLGALMDLSLDENQLTGPIPAELGQLGALMSLALHVNQLSGPIPAELGQLGALCVLGLHKNQLSGPIPAELGQLGALMSLGLHENQLSGPIPAELGQMGALENLALFNNQLTGQEAFLGHMQAHNPECNLGL
jgi:Leucine-rich repeat (LRR) protein